MGKSNHVNSVRIRPFKDQHFYVLVLFYLEYEEFKLEVIDRMDKGEDVVAAFWGYDLKRKKGEVHLCTLSPSLIAHELDHCVTYLLTLKDIQKYVRYRGELNEQRALIVEHLTFDLYEAIAPLGCKLECYS